MQVARHRFRVERPRTRIRRKENGEGERFSGSLRSRGGGSTPVAVAVKSDANRVQQAIEVDGLGQDSLAARAPGPAPRGGVVPRREEVDTNVARARILS